MSTSRMTWWSPAVVKSGARHGEAEEARLVGELAAGSREALAKVYGQHSRRVFRVAFQHCASREAAEEIAQETFLVLLRNPGSFDPGRGELGAFLAGVARQLAKKWLSNTHRNSTEEWDDARTDARTTEPGTRDTLGEMIARQQWQRLHEAVATLPEPYREAVVLHHLEGLPYQEAASAMGCPVGTIRSRLARAREMLASKLAGRGATGSSPPAEEASPGSGGALDRGVSQKGGEDDARTK